LSFTSLTIKTKGQNLIKIQNLAVNFIKLVKFITKKQILHFISQSHFNKIVRKLTVANEQMGNEAGEDGRMDGEQIRRMGLSPQTKTPGYVTERATRQSDSPGASTDMTN